jgi:FKBP-type peptidyl-prolyl cis-trans isomerase
MRAGGTRRMVVPPELAFPGGARFPGGEVPAGSTLTYTVKLLRVSVPPS